MSVEMRLLNWTLALALAQLLIVIVLNLGKRGILWSVGPRDQAPDSMGLVGNRMERAFRNFLETIPLFAAAVLAVQATGGANAHTALGATLYFWARAARVPLYAPGLPWLRSLARGAVLACIVLVMTALLRSAGRRRRPGAPERAPGVGGKTHHWSARRKSAIRIARARGAGSQRGAAP